MTLGRFGAHPATALVAVLVASLMLVHPSAYAHAQIQGMEDFSGGLIHPLLTPEHVLILLTLGLLLGQQHPLELRSPLSAFAPASAIGLLLTTVWQLPVQWQAALPVLAMGIALLVVRAAGARRWAQILLFAASGLMIGLDSGLETGASITRMAVTSVGTWISINVVLANVAYYVSLCPQRKWVQIGIRVAASWIVAICLLVLAFSLKA